MHKIIKDLETDITLAFSESHAERVAAKTRSKYMTASKQVQNISPASGRIHDTGDDLNPTLVGEAGGFGRGLDVRAFGCVVGFIVHSSATTLYSPRPCLYIGSQPHLGQNLKVVPSFLNKCIWIVDFKKGKSLQLPAAQALR